jgi:hypothetical protein
MQNEERLKIVQEFAQTVRMGPERVLAISDRIQQAAHRRPELTARCKFGRSGQVRRLRTIAAKHWNGSDWTVAQAVLDEVASLKAEADTPTRNLALAVLGVEADGLEAALGELEGTRELEGTLESPAEARDITRAPNITRPERQSGRKKV